MINFIKRDFNGVSMALEYLVGRKIPFGIKLVYYIIVGAVALPFVPFAWLRCKIQLKRFENELKKYK